MWLLELLLKKQQGVTVVEYALLAAILAIVAVTALSFVGTQINTTFSSLVSSL
jgi:pilus assembly protein Flp/PilA